MAEEKVTPSVLFVYGTLREGFHNHRFLNGAKLLGAGRVPGAMFIYTHSGIPALTDQFSKSYDPYYGTAKLEPITDSYAVGEVYEIPENLWPALDRLESHPRWYQRKVADISFIGKNNHLLKKAPIKAWVYYMPYNQIGANGSTFKVESGDFKIGYAEFQKCIATQTESWEAVQKKRLGL